MWSHPLISHRLVQQWDPRHGLTFFLATKRVSVYFIGSWYFLLLIELCLNNSRMSKDAFFNLLARLNAALNRPFNRGYDKSPEEIRKAVARLEARRLSNQKMLAMAIFHFAHGTSKTVTGLLFGRIGSSTIEWWVHAFILSHRSLPSSPMNAVFAGVSTTSFGLLWMFCTQERLVSHYILWDQRVHPIALRFASGAMLKILGANLMKLSNEHNTFSKGTKLE